MLSYGAIQLETWTFASWKTTSSYHYKRIIILEVCSQSALPTYSFLTAASWKNESHAQAWWFSISQDTWDPSAQQASVGPLWSTLQGLRAAVQCSSLFWVLGSLWVMSASGWKLKQLSALHSARLSKHSPALSSWERGPWMKAVSPATKPTFMPSAMEIVKPCSSPNMKPTAQLFFLFPGPSWWDFFFKGKVKWNRKLRKRLGLITCIILYVLLARHKSEEQMSQWLGGEP